MMVYKNGPLALSACHQSKPAHHGVAIAFSLLHLRGKCRFRRRFCPCHWEKTRTRKTNKYMSMAAFWFEWREAKLRACELRGISCKGWTSRVLEVPRDILIECWMIVTICKCFNERNLRLTIVKSHTQARPRTKRNKYHVYLNKHVQDHKIWENIYIYMKHKQQQVTNTMRFVLATFMVILIQAPITQIQCHLILIILWQNSKTLTLAYTPTNAAIATKPTQPWPLKIRLSLQSSKMHFHKQSHVSHLHILLKCNWV